jgi:hypothetical protein
MRLKLKYVLSPLQMLLAVAFLVWTDHWERALRRIQDMPGPRPSFTLLIAINAPLAMPRALIFRYLPGRWDEITLVVAIGMFWYWVSLNIESWQRSRRVFVFSWMPSRLAVDTIAIGIGAMWVFVLAHNRTYQFPALVSSTVSSTDWMWFVPCMCLPILWSAALILLFGRDFAQCVLASKG